MNALVLQNETLSLEFDREYGTLIGLTCLSGGSWPLLGRPHLGLSFRLLVPLPWRRNNQILGEKQKPSSVEVSADGCHAVIVWDRVNSEHGGAHDIAVRVEVGLSARQAVFAVTVENNSEHVVENVYCPYLGDVQRPPSSEWLKTFSPFYGTAEERFLWPTFENMRGYFGVDYPTQLSQHTWSCGAPTSPFILLRGSGQGLYVGVGEPSAELMAWHAELRPGYGSSIDSRVPDGSAVGRKEVSTRFAAVHVPYILPGETRRLTPVVLEAYVGGWQRGADIYKAWSDTWLHTPKLPEWAAEPHAWQQIHINSPEDELRVRFTDLPRLGEECARHGVKAIQLVGWNDGGQDQGNPSHDPDPRLGTFSDLRDAIARIQAMGVKLVLFAKFTWADRATPRFREDLVKLAVKDPYGDYYVYGGYQYQTATQLLDINTKRLIPMCFLSADYLKVCEEEFAKTVALGADGILFDECQHHSPTLLCFASDHGHRFGAPVYANDRLLIKRFSRIADREGFLFAGEGCYDWEFEAYHVSYHRSHSKSHIPLSRYLRPDAPLMTAVTGFDDRNMINQCLLYRYIISYEPYNFKGHLDDFPLTVAYGRRMDALRAELREFFWDGEYHDTLGAGVTVEGKAHHPYSVFISRATGKRGIVIANYGETESITARVSLDGGGTLGLHRLIDDSTWRHASEGVSIPPCSAAVVVEQ